MEDFDFYHAPCYPFLVKNLNLVLLGSMTILASTTRAHAYSVYAPYPSTEAQLNAEINLDQIEQSIEIVKKMRAIWQQEVPRAEANREAYCFVELSSGADLTYYEFHPYTLTHILHLIREQQDGVSSLDSPKVTPGLELNAPEYLVKALVDLTDGERTALESVSAIETKTKAQVIEKTIETKNLLMEISMRLYRKEIDADFKEANQFPGLLYRARPLCYAFTLMHERDRNLAQACDVMLTMYDELKRNIVENSQP